MNNPAFIAKEIAAQEAEAKEQKVPAPFVNPPQSVTQPPSILDLPDEVKKNINPHKLEEMELDEMLQRLVNSRTHAIDCDRMIQLLWVEFKRSPERAKVQNRLRALAKAGIISKSAGRSAYERLPAQPSIFDNKPQKE